MLSFVATVSVIVLAAVTYIAWELRRAPLIDDPDVLSSRDEAHQNLTFPPRPGKVVITHYDCGCVAVNDVRQHTCVTCEIDENADAWVSTWAEQQREEGR